MTSYPLVPWKLQGYGLVNVQSIDVETVRPLLPKDLEILQIFPGKTLGGIYLAAYEAGSELQYNELIVFGGVARRANRVGIWPTHIYVDSAESVAGGREIWGLPKQLATFTWESNGRSGVSVHQNSQLLCQFTAAQALPGISLPIPPLLGGFSTVETNLIWFSAEATANFHLLTGTNIYIPSDSPFASLGLDQPFLSVRFDQLQLQVNAPKPC